jgi:hypothetical protein
VTIVGIVGNTQLHVELSKQEFEHEREDDERDCFMPPIYCSAENCVPSVKR